MNNSLRKTGGRLLLLLVLTGFLTTCSGAGGGTAKVSLDQVDLTYLGISAVAGGTGGNTSSPSWSVIHSEIDYSITPGQAGASIDANGVVTVDTNALDATVFTVTAKAKDGSTKYTGSQTATLFIQVTAEPGAPVITGSLAGNGEVNVSWEAPENTGMINGDGTIGTITGYTVYWGNTEEDTSSWKKADVTGTTSYYTITGLTNGEKVYFIVTAWNAMGEGAASKKASATPSATSVFVTSVAIDDTGTSTVTMGSTLQLSATIQPENASDKRVSWESSDESIATVSAGGLVTPVKVGGPVTITVKAQGGVDITATILITVEAIPGSFISLNEVDLTYPNISAVTGETSGNTSTPSWSVTHSEIAYSITPARPGVSIDAEGVVTVNRNEALNTAVMVTARAKEGSTKYKGSQTAFLTIKVTAAESLPGAPVITGSLAGDEEVEVFWEAPEDTGIINGGGTKGTITGYTVYWGNAEVDTSSPNQEDVTGCSTYTITGLTNGEKVYFIVTAKNDAGVGAASEKASATPSATSVSVTSVAIDGTRTVTMGSSLQLSAAIQPDTASDKRVIWESSDESIATVSAGGLVTPVKVGGPVTITVKSEDDNSIEGTIDITVEALSINSLGYDGISGEVGSTTTYISPEVVPPMATGTFAVTAGTLPTGLNLDSKRGVISGTLSPDGSSEVTITMTGTGDYGEETAEAKVSISAYTLPGAPGITGSIAKDREVQIDWTVPTHTGSINGAPRTITKYTVYWGGATGVNTNSSSKEDVTGTTYTITGLTNGNPVYFIVTAWNEAVEGGASAEESATPQVSVSGVTIEDAGTSTVTMQGSLQLSATIQPATATYKGVTWESSDGSIATVSTDGLVTPVKVGGPVTITVKSEDDNSIMDTIDIRVKGIAIQSLIYGTTISNTAGSEITAITPTVDPAAAVGTFTVTAGTLPPGLNLDSDTGVISGTPSSGGIFQVTITMKGSGDYEGERAVSTVDIGVNEVPGVPVISGLLVGDAQVEVSWEAPQDRGIINGDGTIGTITGYTVYWGNADVDTSSLNKEEVAGDVLTSTITELTNGEKVYFIVTAQNAAGEGAASEKKSATPSATPEPVTSVTIDDTGTSTVTMGSTLQLSATIQPETCLRQEGKLGIQRCIHSNRQCRWFGYTRESGRRLP